LLAIAYFSGRLAQIDSLGDKDREMHLVGQGLSIAPDYVLFALAKHGGDDILFHEKRSFHHARLAGPASCDPGWNNRNSTTRLKASPLYTTEIVNSAWS
jgi:hypothetical protein